MHRTFMSSRRTTVTGKSRTVSYCITRDRVFVVGSKHEPETLKRALKIGFEAIGKSLANDCDTGTAECWDHEQLQHNDAERRRLVQIVKPFLF
jgi:hypothetical protein